MPLWWWARRPDSEPRVPVADGEQATSVVRDGLPPMDDALLRQALSHPSYVREQRLAPYSSNQRLEFLGDAVLDVIIAEHLYRQFPEEPEGELTRRKAALVRKSSLAEIARQINLGDLLLLGRGEEETGGRRKASILADALEAAIGALYLSRGWEAARAFILDKFSGLLAQEEAMAVFDAKTELQELIQSRTKRLPAYDLSRISGPPHERRFEIRVSFRGRVLGQGEGAGKRTAEQAAAREALEHREEWRDLLEVEAEAGTHDGAA